MNLFDYWEWLSAFIVLAIATGAVALWLRSRQLPDEDLDVQRPLEPHEVAEDLPAVEEVEGTARLVKHQALVDEIRHTANRFEPKPADLVAAVAGEWTRPRSRNGTGHATAAGPASATMPWTAEPPAVPGPYWYSDGLSSAIRPCVVVEYGTRLSVRRREGGGSTFIAVDTLTCWWVGPLAMPEHIQLDQIEI